MRVWDVEPELLCRAHLLGEHRELHGLWSILTKHGGRGGYAMHPETMRWAGKEASLFRRHEALVSEMRRRGYQHHSELDERLSAGSSRVQDVLLVSVEEQKRLLRDKPCGCFVAEVHS